MKKHKLILTILSVFTIFYLLFSCSREPYQVKQFLIQVDSIDVPVALNINKSFDIAFYGTIGTNGCFRFEAFNQTFNNYEIYLEAWGSYNYQATVCPSVMVYLDGRKMTLTLTDPGIYTIRIKQPDGKPLIKEITVN
jgi:hypothetical protein